MRLYQLFLSIAISLTAITGYGKSLEPVNVVRLKVVKAVEPIATSSSNQVGFTIQGSTENYYLSCYSFPSEKSEKAAYRLQGTYGAMLRIAGSHLLRDNGEFLTGLSGPAQYEQCIQYIHQIRAQFLQPGAKVLVIKGYAHTAVDFDVVEDVALTN